MIVTWEGQQGSGKTTAAVAFAYEEHKANGRKVISNNHLNFDFTKFSLEFFIEHLADHEMEDCVLFLDEMYQIADSRSSGSKLNKLFTYFMVQTRKRNVDVYFCTHYLDHVDLRLRRAADIRNSCKYRSHVCPKCKCKKCGATGQLRSDGRNTPCSVCNGVGGTGLDPKTDQPCETCMGYGQLGWITLNIVDRRVKTRYTPPDLFANPYWHLFDSWDRLPMPAKVLQGIDTAEIM
ncbi:hypothetical protein LCGC14_0683720 [marine sediment metagenome]|uniref:ATPase AAA-type core domain-containing protein n=1 Tax=marine sediment metagenome TaxID=412755 RepID=A0A0F9T8W3_9ZZZZ